MFISDSTAGNHCPANAKRLTFFSKIRNMKISKNQMAFIVAGAAVAGFATFLLGTNKGKDVVNKAKSKGRLMLTKAEKLAVDTKEKFSCLQNDWKNKSRKEATFSPAVQEVEA
jgi:hypothetical protein